MQIRSNSCVALIKFKFSFGFRNKALSLQQSLQPFTTFERHLWKTVDFFTLT